MNQISYRKFFTNNFKFNSFSISFTLPLNEMNATSCALLSLVLKRGCNKYGEMDTIVSVLEELYGASVSVTSDKVGENIVFSLQGNYMDDSFTVEGERVGEKVLDLMSSILLDPVLENGCFRNDFFEGEKSNLQDMIAGLFNDKRVFSIKRCKEIMFKDQPYSLSSYGTERCLSELTNADLYEFYKNMLSTCFCQVVYIGREAAVESLTDFYFGGVAKNAARNFVLPRLADAGEMKEIEEAYQVAQGKLCMGFRLDENVDWSAAQLFNTVYGGSPTSKLFMNVRERLSLCYYCSSSMDPFVNCMFISSGIEFENFAVARDEIYAQLEDMKNGNITDEEFKNGKAYLLDYFKGIGDSHGAMISEAIRGTLLGNEQDVADKIKKIEKMTIDDIVSVAKHLVPDTVYFLKGKEK